MNISSYNSASNPYTIPSDGILIADGLAKNVKPGAIYIINGKDSIIGVVGAQGSKIIIPVAKGSVWRQANADLYYVPYLKK